MVTVAESGKQQVYSHIFHIKYSTVHAKTKHVFHYSTEGWPKELGSAMMSHIVIYSIKWFNFRVVCPLHALLSKNLLMLQTFPIAQLMFYNFIQLL